MGDTAVTSSASAPIQLTEAEFWRFQARSERAARCRQEANFTAQAIEARQAERLAIEVLDALAEKYGFDRTTTMTFDEASLSLVPVPPQ